MKDLGAAAREAGSEVLHWMGAGELRLREGIEGLGKELPGMDVHDGGEGRAGWERGKQI